MTKSKSDPKLSPKLRAHSTIDLEVMASGLRSMRHGQKRLLKLIEEEIARRRQLGGGPA